MRKLPLILLSSLCTLNMYAQEIETTATVTPGKNIIKLNLPALALKNISVQYERAIAKKMTVAGTFRYMPDGDIPLKSAFIKLADDPDVERQLNNLKVGNMAVMPEIRFYLGKRGAFHGFYLAPTVKRNAAAFIYIYMTQPVAYHFISRLGMHLYGNLVSHGTARAKKCCFHFKHIGSHIL